MVFKKMMSFLFLSESSESQERGNECYVENNQCQQSILVWEHRNTASCKYTYILLGTLWLTQV